MTKVGSKKTSTKNVLQDHSRAKVKLYTDYLSVYLSILGNSGTSQVHLFDVLCGEGKYADGEDGSALKGLRTILAYYSSTPYTRMKLRVRLNDFGQSDVEAGCKKIHRVEGFASGIPLPADKVSVGYTDLEYSKMLEEVEATLQSMSGSEKSLIFIDPWGYKSISPQKLNNLIKCGRSEILLFLPTTHMYRFANAAVAEMPEEEVLNCFKPLKRLLEELFDNDVPRFRSFEKFEAALFDKLKIKLGANYASSFTLETVSRNKYSLFFFTPNIKGLDAFHQACWKLDPQNGRGHLFCKNPSQLSLSLFGNSNSQHIELLREFIKNSPATNRQVYEFGIVNRCLTKTTNAAINYLRKNGEVDVEALDGGGKPKMSANYLKYSPERIVQFKYISNGTV